MRLRHEPDAEDGHDAATLATDVELADGFLRQARGLMFRRSIPDGYALVFRFDDVATRDVHMAFVPFPIDVLWIVDGAVRRVETLRPWLGFARETADTIVELPAGAAGGVAVGDRIVLEDGTGD